MDILNKSKNFYRCVGTVYELGLKRAFFKQKTAYEMPK